jgi:hypothetical protein
MVVIHGLAEVADDPILQGPALVSLIGICGNKDRWDRAPRLDEISVELNASHSGHLDVGEKTVGFRQETRSQKIGGRCEDFDCVPQRPKELFQRVSKGLIVVNDRYQSTFGIAACGQFFGPVIAALSCLAPINNCVVSAMT